MSILARLEQQHESAERRGSPRRMLRLETEGSAASDSHARVVIHDISRTGLLIETSAALPVGTRLEVQLPEAGPVDSSIVWRSGRFFGCRFAQPLSRAALSAALLRSPGPSSAAERERPSPVQDALAEVELLRARVQLLTATVDDAITRLESEAKLRRAAAPPPASAIEIADTPAAEEEEEADTRLSFSMRMRIILGLAIGSWALILWLAGAF